MNFFSNFPPAVKRPLYRTLISQPCWYHGSRPETYLKLWAT